MAESMNSEMLNYAIEQGIIDLSHIQDAVNMNKRKEILEQHPYSIWESKDGKWHTYLPDEEKGRVPRRRNTREAIEDVIVRYYEEQENCTFEYWWGQWVEKKKKFGVVENTIYNYERDYEKYFQNNPFSQKDIRDITEDDIIEFIVNQIKKYNLGESSAKKLIGYICGVFKNTRRKKFTKENACEFIETKDFMKRCGKIAQPIEQRVLSPEEWEKFAEEVKKRQKKDPMNMCLYAIELAMYTGMRLGELCGLMWEDVRYDLDCIVIRHSEKMNKKTRQRYIAATKTSKERLFPLTPPIKRLFAKVKKEQMKNNCYGEFVFTDQIGKIYDSLIQSNVVRCCTAAGIPRKSIHAIRRTLNSKLRTDGMSAVVAGSLFGHSSQVNNKNYTYDISNMEYKKKALSRAYKVK